MAAATTDDENAPYQCRRRFITVAVAVMATHRFSKHVTAACQCRRKLKRVAWAITATTRFYRHRFETRLKIREELSDEELNKRCVDLVRHGRRQELELLGSNAGVANILETSWEKGIRDDPDEVNRRKTLYGENIYPKHRRGKPLYSFLREAVDTECVIMVLACVVASLSLGILEKNNLLHISLDGGMIAVSYVFVVTVTGVSEYIMAVQFDQAQGASSAQIFVQVVRGGKRVQIHISDIVVGDIIPLKPGDYIPADGLLGVGQSLQIDKSDVSVEPDLLTIDQNCPFLRCGSKIVAGNGLMLVTAAGIHTSLAPASGNDHSAFHVLMVNAASTISKISMVVSFSLFGVVFTLYFTGHYHRGVTKPESVLTYVIRMVLTLVRVALPKGLPLAATIALTYSVTAVRKAGTALVLSRNAFESIGAATIICFDTCTPGMVVHKLWIPGWAGEEFPDNIDVLNSGIRTTLLEEFLIQVRHHPTIVENRLAMALQTWGETSLGMGLDVNGSCRSFDVQTTCKLLPDMECRGGGGCVQLVNDRELRFFCIGAADSVLSKCDKWSINGQASSLTQEIKAEIKVVIDKMLAAALHCVAFGYSKQATEHPTSNNIPFTLVAIVGIKDPCQSWKHAVRTCKDAGVRILLFMEECLPQAQAIAEDCGILEEGYAIEASEFCEYDQEKKKDEVTKISVVANASLGDVKLEVVKTLQSIGQIVLVASLDKPGDAEVLQGSNVANVAISMGARGLQFVKQSPGIIILNDNLATIVEFMECRNWIYTTVQKIVRFILPVEVVGAVVDWLSVSTVQTLFVNILITFGIIALVTEASIEGQMYRTPVSHKQYPISIAELVHFIGQFLCQIGLLLTIWFQGKRLTDSERNTMISNMWAFSQICNLINARELKDLNIFKGILSSPRVAIVVVIFLVGQVLLVNFAGNYTGTVWLNAQQWLICIVAGLLTWMVTFLIKFILFP